MAKRLRVYVAGPYSADNVLGVLRNIGRGEEVCAALFMEGYSPFCPWHDKTYAMHIHDERLQVDDFREHSMSWLEVSDVLFLVEGWQKSQGTKAEIRRARELGIPIFDRVEALDQWRGRVAKESA